MAECRFPFGRTVSPVAPTADSQRNVFVLGVYPSAVHARWIGADGRQAIKAVAVDNEPEPFWTGVDAPDRIESVNEDLPDGVGHLQAAEQNGPSGLTLEARYLMPLGVINGDCWVTDLENRWLANTAQLDALARSYQPLVDEGQLPAFSLHERPKEIGLVADRAPALREEWEAAAPEVLVTLGAEPARALSLTGPSQAGYGQPTNVTVWDRTVNHLALVHPRQAGALGNHSGKWAAIHQTWIESSPTLGA